MITGQDKIKYESLQRKYKELSQEYAKLKQEKEQEKPVDKSVEERAVPVLHHDELPEGYCIYGIHTTMINGIKCYDIQLEAPYFMENVSDLGAYEELVKRDLIISGILERFGVKSYVETSQDMLDYASLHPDDAIAFEIGTNYYAFNSYSELGIRFYVNKPVKIPSEILKEICYYPSKKRTAVPLPVENNNPDTNKNISELIQDETMAALAERDKMQKETETYGSEKFQQLLKKLREEKNPASKTLDEAGVTPA